MTGIALALTWFPDRAQGLSTVFGSLSLVMLVGVPLTFTILDAAAAARQRRQWR